MPRGISTGAQGPRNRLQVHPRWGKRLRQREVPAARVCVLLPACRPLHTDYHACGEQDRLGWLRQLGRHVSLLQQASEHLLFDDRWEAHVCVRILLLSIFSVGLGARVFVPEYDPFCALQIYVEVIGGHEVDHRQASGGRFVFTVGHCVCSGSRATERRLPLAREFNELFGNASGWPLSGHR